MYRVLTCLTVQHNYRLVILAALICAAGALASFKIYSHVSTSRGVQRLMLLLLTGVCSASGIWATHFIAMLAYDAGFPIAYDPAATAASFLIAVVATTSGFIIAASGARWQPAIGGAVIGAGIGLMHYSGMYALIVPGASHWEPSLVIASLAVGGALASMAMIAFNRLTGRRALLGAAGLLVLAIVSLHFTAMGAATIAPDPTVLVPPSPIDASLMVVALSGATSVIMLSGIASTALMESHMRRQREHELAVQNSRFDTALAHMGEGLCMFDGNKRLVVCNERYARMYRLPPELLKPGIPHDDVIAHRVRHGILRGETNQDAVRRMISTLGALPPDMTSSRIDELADGRLVCVTRQPMPDGGWVATHRDVTEQRRTEAKIAYMAQHDALTDLPNRMLLHERLDHALACARCGRHVATLMLDLDRFKEVNDTLGHPVGDMLLKAVALRLRECVRESATIARLGGDEFAIVEVMTNPVAGAAELAGRIRDALRAPFDLGDYQVVVGASIGIAVAPRDGIDTDEILKKADLALYRAKNSGGGAHRFFEPEMDQVMRTRSALERDLRSALVNGEFDLHYQPFVNLRSGQISAVALAPSQTRIDCAG